MGNDYLSSNSYINSIVGEGTFLKGDIKTDGLIRIDGGFIGSIKSNSKVLIGKNGRAESVIVADTVVVGGIVKGNIYANDRIIILNSGVVIGNVKAPRLIVEENVLLNGRCTVSKNDVFDVDDEADSFQEKKDINSYNPSLRQVR